MKLKFMLIALAIIVGIGCATNSTVKADLVDYRTFRPPDFSGQEGAIGYKPGAENGTFSVPANLRKQVEFWKEIYTKYSTYQGVIHDAEDVAKQYAVLDLSEIMTSKDLSAYAKDKKVEKLIERTKKEIAEREHMTRAQERNLRFQGGLRDRFIKAIYESGRYLETMEEIFRENNLPIELTRIVFVESSFNVFARSRVGASGIWQIMPYTARPYRMISKSVDLRNHPVEATKLAAKLLRNNYEMLESWPLAVTGYNHGPAGVRNMTKKYKTRDLGDLVENITSRRRFGFASQNFYTSFLAALEVEKNARTYFPQVTWAPRMDNQRVKLPRHVSYPQMLSWFEGDERKLQMYNPHLTSMARSHQTGVIPQKTTIDVPRSVYDQVVVALASSDHTKVIFNENEVAEKPRRVERRHLRKKSNRVIRS